MFVRLDWFGAKAVEESHHFGHEPGFEISHAAYPQIDPADTPAVREWNVKARKTLDNAVGDETSDAEVGYDFGLVTKQLISVRWYWYEYGHGTPHGMSASHVWNAVLGPPYHDLAPADLFDMKSGWQIRLGKIALSCIEQNGWSPPSNDVEEAEQSVIRKATDIKSWFLQNDGIEIAFSSYDGGCYACTPHDGLIPWAKLAPMMIKTMLVP